MAGRSRGAVRTVMRSDPAQIGGFHRPAGKGGDNEEIYGAALAMREKAVAIRRGKRGLLDTCGTGATEQYL